MPILRDSKVLAVRGIRAFLNIEAGITRSNAPQPIRPRARSRRPVENGKPARKSDGIKAENVVWIFGFGRSGSTWLSSMMGDMSGHAVWPEPLIGLLFGRFYYEGVQEVHRQNSSFILGPEKETWLKLIRSFFLDAASERFPKAARNEDILVVKEQNGSIGAPLLMDALPESRMILLVRDPRDVAASAMEALKKEGWGVKGLRLENPPAFDASWWAGQYVQLVGNSKQAYDDHKGPKTLVRYEDLRADALGTMRRAYSELDIKVDDEEFSRIVEKHSWENIPEENKGQGKFYRKATPGGWKEDLSPEEAETVEEICEDLMHRFGYL